MNVTEAVQEFKDTQPELDRIRPVKKRNDAAREIVIGHMRKKGLTEYRGISLREVPFETWDGAKLHSFLGDKVAAYRREASRCYLNLIKRKR